MFLFHLHHHELLLFHLHHHELLLFHLQHELLFLLGMVQLLGMVILFLELNLNTHNANFHCFLLKRRSAMPNFKPPRKKSRT